MYCDVRQFVECQSRLPVLANYRSLGEAFIIKLTAVYHSFMIPFSRSANHQGHELNLY